MSAHIPANLLGRRYLLLDVLGKGGMGVVYRALDRLLNQEVALKRVLTDPQDIGLSSSYNLMDFRLAMAQEFKLSASLRHPHIIEVLDYGFDEDSQPYFTMELLDAPQTIFQYGHAQTIELRLKLIVQMLQALAYLHRRGIIHRDLKPANVLVTQGLVKLLDFGLSTMHQADTEVDGLAVGTLAYMAPEVLMGQPSTIASDLYALGMISYELLMGKHPFSVHEPSALIQQIIHVLPDVELLDVPQGAAEIIGRLLEKNPLYRYASADEVLETFSHVITMLNIHESVAIRESFLKAARLVGREHEIQTLTIALNDALRGQGSMWLVAGESGVGKSRLIDEVRTLALVRGVRVMRGQAIKVGGRPFEMWLMVLRWLCLLDDALSDEQLGVLSFFVPDIYTLVSRDVNLNATEPIELDSALNRLLQVVMAILERQKQPVLILFEDLHWAGSESIRILQQLADEVRHLPLLIVGTYRDDESPNFYQQFASIPVLKLGRLPQESIAQLSEAMLGEVGKQAQVVDLLQRETEGNVFFLIEVVRALAEEAGRLDQIGQTTLPERVFAGGMKAVIQRRLNRVDSAGHHCLKIAALMGRFIDVQLLRSMDLGISIEWWLTECANAAVLELVDGQWRFTHDKLREGVLSELDSQERRTLHQHIAIGLETYYGASSAHFTALAHHWDGAGDADKAEHYLMLSGEYELRNGAYHEAIAFFEQALAQVEKTSQPTDQKDQKRVMTRQKMGDAFLGLGDYARAQRLYQDSLQLAERIGDEQGAARALGHLGDVAGVLSRFTEAQDYYEQSLKLYTKLNDSAGISRTLNQLGDIAFELGEHDRAKRLYQESLNLAREIGERWGMAGAYRTQEIAVIPPQTTPKDAKTVLQEMLNRHQEEQNPTDVADALYNLAILSQDAGDIPTARQYLQECILLRETSSDTLGLAQAYERLASLWMAVGDFDQTTHLLRKALSAAIATDVFALVASALLAFARLFIAQGMPSRALELLSFLIYSSDTIDTIQDSAEQLAFGVESAIPPQELEVTWEKGKTATLSAIIQNLMDDR